MAWRMGTQADYDALKRAQQLPRPVVCGHCGGKQIMRDDLETPPEWFCLTCSWRPAPANVLPLTRNRAGQSGSRQR